MTGILVFWLAAIIGVPLCVIAGRLYKPFVYVIFFILIFSTAEVFWSINFVSREFYKSATRGFEIHVLDLCAIILLISMLLRPLEYQLRWRLPLALMYSLYFIIGILSWALFSYTPAITNVPKDLVTNTAIFELNLYPLFELSKMVRGLFMFWVVGNFVINEKALRVLLLAIASIIVFVTMQALVNRYIYREFRVTIKGLNFNDFNVYVGMLAVFILPWAFSSSRKLVSLGIWMVFLMGLTTIILTISRSSLVGCLLGAMFVMILSLMRYPSFKNIFAVAGCFVASLALVAKASRFLLPRFAETSHDLPYREALETIATLMANDYTFGVGLGNYAAMNYLKYAAIIRAPESYIIAHNIWYLTMAETGYIGLLVFALLWIRFYYFLTIGLLRSRWVPLKHSYEVFLGTFGASIPLQLQGIYHFSFRQTSVFFLFMILLGTAASYYYMQRRLASHAM